MAVGDERLGESEVDAAVTPPSPALALPPKVLSERTRRFYAQDWATFAAWCQVRGVAPLPAAAAVLCAYVDAMTERLSPGALARRLAAIGEQHRRHGHVAPTADLAVKAVLRAARLNALPRRDRPPSAAQLARMIAACPGDLAGLRDRALLGLMLATGLGRAALVSLEADAVRFDRTAAQITVAEDGTARTLLLSREAAHQRCPVRALEDWLRVSGTRFGPVFRKIDRWGNVEYRRLGTDAVRRILTRRAIRRPRRGAGANRVAEPALP